MCVSAVCAFVSVCVSVGLCVGASVSLFLVCKCEFVCGSVCVFV